MTVTRVRVNEKIRARQVRVIADEGEQLGIMSPQDALREAEERGLDLVEVAPNATPPVCRILDYGKYKYQQSKRAKESKKHQHVVTIKEVKYRPKIDKHDFEYKTNHVREFLMEGNKVKVTVMFRGREMAHPEFGREIIAKVFESVSSLCEEQYDPHRARLEGRNMCVMLTPGKGVAAALKAAAEARKTAEAAPKSESGEALELESDVELDLEPENGLEPEQESAPTPEG